MGRPQRVKNGPEGVASLLSSKTFLQSLGPEHRNAFLQEVDAAALQGLHDGGKQEVVYMLPFVSADGQDRALAQTNHCIHLQ
jgi:hypothetical protein